MRDRGRYAVMVPHRPPRHGIVEGHLDLALFLEDCGRELCQGILD